MKLKSTAACGDVRHTLLQESYLLELSLQGKSLRILAESEIPCQVGINIVFVGHFYTLPGSL